MYSIHCKTCSEEATAETYDEANDVFEKHATRRHEVELVNEARADYRPNAAPEQSAGAD